MEDINFALALMELLMKTDHKLYEPHNEKTDFYLCEFAKTKAQISCAVQ